MFINRSLDINHPIFQGLEITGTAANVHDPALKMTRIVVIKENDIPTVPLPIRNGSSNASAETKFVYQNKEGATLLMKVKTEFQPEKIEERIKNFRTIAKFVNELNEVPPYGQAKLDTEWEPLPFFEVVDVAKKVADFARQRILPKRDALNKILLYFGRCETVSIEDAERLYRIIRAKNYPENMQERASYKTYSDMMEVYVAKAGLPNYMDQRRPFQTNPHLVEELNAKYQPLILQLETIFNEKKCPYTYGVLLKAYNRTALHDKFRELYSDSSIEKDDWSYAEKICFEFSWYGMDAMVQAFNALAQTTDKLGKTTFHYLMRNFDQNYPLALDTYAKLPNHHRKLAHIGFSEVIFRSRPALISWLKYFISQDTNFRGRFPHLTLDLAIDDATRTQIDYLFEDKEDLQVLFTANLYNMGYYNLAQYIYDNIINNHHKPKLTNLNGNGFKIDLHFNRNYNRFDGSYCQEYCDFILKYTLDSFAQNYRWIMIVPGRGEGYNTRGMVENFLNKRKIENKVPENNPGEVDLNKPWQYQKERSKFEDLPSELLSIVNGEN